MSLLAQGTIELLKCPVCGAKVTQMRRGRCVSCYSNWIESQPVAVGASCRVCGERRRQNIQRVELLGRWYYMCHLCAYKAQRLDPMPKHIEGV
ncbi:60S ribosomal export protein NMD3, partial [Myxococcota bacterium]|nr:60S ribosomal export protein NMD3 [Myxococcota bacterium]